MIGTDSDSAGPRAGAELLLVAAAPELYRRNAFRAAELPVDAAALDLSRRQQRLEVAARTGLPAPAGPGRILPLEPEAEDGADGGGLREALQRLRDPERRLIDELFWFWPLEAGKSAEDEALQALAQGDLEAATAVWRRVERRPDLGGIATHNLAVLAHAVALDLELLGLQRPLQPAERERRDACWHQALAAWSRLQESESFWRLFGARIRTLDDPRLTSGLARRLRQQLPLAILMINTQLAVRLAERSALAEAARQARLLRESGLPAEAIEEAQRRAVEPIRSRLVQLCRSTEQEADADPANADQPTRRLIERGRELLAVVDMVLPAGDQIRDGLHDEVALRILVCQITFGNRTNDWQISTELLEAALALAVSSSARDRIQENLTIVRGNLESRRDFDTCWFCRHQGSGRPASDADVLAVKLHGDVVRTRVLGGTNVQWRNMTVQVPRCAYCRGRHKLAATVGGLIIAIAVLLGLAACNSSHPPNGISFFVILGLGWALSMGLSSVACGGVKGEGWKSEFPRIKELRGQGWAFGEKPSGVK